MSVPAERRSVKRVAVMQPYFFPYAGYFRLLASVDEFVIFDCVQFPRRGRVHRSQVGERRGTPQWLTLPLAQQPRDTRIADLRFAAGARDTFDRRVASCRWIAAARGPHADRVRAFLAAPLESPIDYVESSLRFVCDLLGLHPVIRRSSSMRLKPELRGQGRVLAIVQQTGGTHYLNAPGGRDLYDADVFAREGVALAILDPYRGAFAHLLPALLSVDASEIRDDVLAGCDVSW